MDTFTLLLYFVPILAVIAAGLILWVGRRGAPVRDSRIGWPEANEAISHRGAERTEQTLEDQSPVPCLPEDAQVEKLDGDEVTATVTDITVQDSSQGPASGRSVDTSEVDSNLGATGCDVVSEGDALADTLAEHEQPTDSLLGQDLREAEPLTQTETALEVDARSESTASGFDRTEHTGFESPGAARKRRAPVDRGGRPRGPAADSQDGGASTSHRAPKAEVVCYNREQHWLIAVELAAVDGIDEDFEIQQRGNVLAKDDVRQDWWLLQDVASDIEIVRTSDGSCVRRLELGRENCLLFKLGADFAGRRVLRASRGEYAILAPLGFRRDETSGAEYVEPQAASIEGYRFHFFYLDDGGSTTFRLRSDDLNSAIVAEVGRPQFELVGKRLPDYTRRVGPLFAAEPPCIQPINGADWSRVRSVVVLEEGPGRNKWRQVVNAPPAVSREPLILPSELKTRGARWYCVRFYDADERLVDSVDFRLACMFSDIEIHEHLPLPSEGGHAPVAIRFRHHVDAFVEPGCDDARKARLQQADDHTTDLAVPNDPSCDSTSWLIGVTGGPALQITVVLDRLRWAIADDCEEPGAWYDRAIEVERSAFCAASRRVLWIRLPYFGWSGQVQIGPLSGGFRTYEARINSRFVKVPLRDFESYAGVACAELYVCIDHLDTKPACSSKILFETMPVPTANAPIVPPPPPISEKRRWNIQRFAEYYLLHESRLTDMKTLLRALCKCGSAGANDSVLNYLLRRLMSSPTFEDAWRAYVALDKCLAVNEQLRRQKPKWWDNVALPEVARTDIRQVEDWLRSTAH